MEIYSCSLPVVRRIVNEPVIKASLSSERLIVNGHVTEETRALVDAIHSIGTSVLFMSQNLKSVSKDALKFFDNSSIPYVINQDWNIIDKEVERFNPSLMIDNGNICKRILLGNIKAPLLKGVTLHSTGARNKVEKIILQKEFERFDFPIVSMGLSYIKSVLETSFGTGQSTAEAIMRELRWLIAGKRVSVIGYGNAGSGIAKTLRSLGAVISVFDISSLRTLQAHMDGCIVDTLENCLANADLVITATGTERVITRREIALCKNETYFANISNVPNEIDIKDFEDISEVIIPCGPHTVRYLINGRNYYILGEGLQVNHMCACANPSEMLDLSFALHLVVLSRIINTTLAPSVVHPVMREDEEYLSAMKLSTMGLPIIPKLSYKPAVKINFPGNRDNQRSSISRGILVPEPMSEFTSGVLRSYLSQRPQWKLYSAHSSLNEKDYRSIDVIMTGADALDPKYLSKFPNLLVLYRFASGNIDLSHEQNWCRQQGIKWVKSQSNAFVVPTAEHTLMLILALLKGLPGVSNDIQSGRWQTLHQYDGRLEELRNTVVGFIGFGKIAHYLAEILLCCGCKVGFYVPRKKWRPEVPQKVLQYKSLKDLLQVSEVVCLLHRLSKKRDMEEGGKFIFDSKCFNFMKKGSYFINTSRGKYVDHDALIVALRSGHLKGAALDVFEKEPLNLKSKLIGIPNLLLTPHIGGRTKQSVHRMFESCCLEVENILKT